MKHAVILAAGAATRLPNKLLLTAGNGKPLLSSSLEFARQRCENTTVILSAPETPVSNYCSRFYSDCQRVYQRNPLGVCDALSHSLKHLLGKEVLILFGDCYYKQAHIKQGFISHSATVSPFGHKQLDGYHNGRWAYRPTLPLLKFCGWIFTPRKKLDSIAKYSNILDWMNVTQVLPHVLNQPIVDLGTQQSYEEHWTNGKYLSE